MCVCVCVCLLSLYFLYTQVLGANKCYYMNKITMTWIEILHICLEMFGSRVMAVFAYLEDRCEVSRTLCGELLTAKTR